MWRRVCTRAPATADIFYSFEVERKKKGTRSRGEIKTRSRGLVSRPRLRLVHAWADARRTRSFEAMRSIDCVRSRDFRTFRDRIERSIHVESIIPLDSFECATYKVHVHFDSTRIIDGTDDGITQLRAV